MPIPIHDLAFTQHLGHHIGTVVRQSRTDDFQPQQLRLHRQSRRRREWGTTAARPEYV